MSEGLRYLLEPRGLVAQIGPERGRIRFSGISVFRSPFGSVRYVMTDRGLPIAALQLVKLDRKRAQIANVYVLPSRRREGMARELLERARKDFVSILHSEHLSEDGAKWKAAVRDRRMR